MQKSFLRGRFCTLPRFEVGVYRTQKWPIHSLIDNIMYNSTLLGWATRPSPANNV